LASNGAYTYAVSGATCQVTWTDVNGNAQSRTLTALNSANAATSDQTFIIATHASSTITIRYLSPNPITAGQVDGYGFISQVG
jgi:hypothetical protein